MQNERPRSNYTQQQQSPSILKKPYPQDQNDQYLSSPNLSVRTKSPMRTMEAINEGNQTENKSFGKINFAELENKNLNYQLGIEQHMNGDKGAPFIMKTENSNQYNNRESDKENKRERVMNQKSKDPTNFNDNITNSPKEVKTNGEMKEKLIRKFKAKKIKEISLLEKITTSNVFQTLQDEFTSELFVKRQAEVSLTQVNGSKCHHCEFKGNSDCKAVFCPEERFWFKRNGSGSHARKNYVLFDLENGTLEKLLNNSMFVFFTKLVKVDKIHGLVFVTLKTSIAGGFWEIFVQTTDLKFKAVTWDGDYFQVSCSKVLLESFEINFELEEVQERIFKTFSAAGKNCHYYYHTSSRDNDKSLQVPMVETKPPKEVSGSKRSMEEFSEGSNASSNEDPLPQKKVKGTSENVTKIEKKSFQEDIFEEGQKQSSVKVPKKFFTREKSFKKSRRKGYDEFLRSKFEKHGFRKSADPREDNKNYFTIATLINQHGIKTMDGLMDFCFKLLPFKGFDLMCCVIMNSEFIFEKYIKSHENNFEEFMANENDLTEERMQNIFKSATSMWPLKSSFGKKNNPFVRQNIDFKPVTNQYFSTEYVSGSGSESYEESEQELRR